MNIATKILIVEDNPLAARMVRQVFQKLSFDSDIVCNGAMAMDAIKNHAYDLILMDIGLPDKDGFTITHEILSTSLPQPVIIALTGHASNDKRQQCLSVGMQAVVEKPITSDIAQAIVRQFLTKNTVFEAGIIDLVEGAELVGGDANMALELISILLEELPRRLQEIRHAYIQKDYAELRSLFYKIQGGICYCGVPRLRKIVFKLYNTLNDRIFFWLDDLILEFMTEAEKVITVWKQLQLSR